jgi:hypothetical protein
MHVNKHRKSGGEKKLTGVLKVFRLSWLFGVFI